MSKSTPNQDKWIDLLKKNGERFSGEYWNALEKSARPTIFYNPTNHNSMRLTSDGYGFFTKHLNLTVYKFKLSVALTPKQLLQLERFIDYPYYVSNLKMIMIFDEQTAIMLQLHGNDLTTYLNNLEQHQ